MLADEGSISARAATAGPIAGRRRRALAITHTMGTVATIGIAAAHRAAIGVTGANTAVGKIEKPLSWRGFLHDGYVYSIRPDVPACAR